MRLVMSPNGDVTVFGVPRGRPDQETSKKLNVPKAMRKELLKLRDQMKYEGGTEILLAFSICSDEMARHLHMFPEVLFMDVTANTNKQKRDLFLAVVKDASGETFVVNATIKRKESVVRWDSHKCSLLIGVHIIVWIIYLYGI